MFTPVISGLSLCKKICLNFNPVIWRFFDFGPSGHQITKFKVLSPPVIWEIFGLPPLISSILYSQNSWRSKTINLQITGLKSKQFTLQGCKPEIFNPFFNYIRWCKCNPFFTTKLLYLWFFWMTSNLVFNFACSIIQFS